MSASDRAAKEQISQDKRWQNAVDRAFARILADPELWPALQWLYYDESYFQATSYAAGDSGFTIFREGQRSIGFAMQERANRVAWENWQQMRASYEKPRPKGASPQDGEAEESEDV